MLTKKNAKAWAILSILCDILHEKQWEELLIEPYLNGRESGFSIKSFDKQVVFSENRNSDHIVIYFGQSKDFNMQGNIPNEKIYRNKRLFQHYQYLEAANYIEDLLFE